MSLEKLELKPKKIQVRITMKPVVFTDEYYKKPTVDNILENFAKLVYERMFDEHFEVVVKAAE